MKHLCVFLITLLAGAHAVVFEDTEEEFKKFVRDYNEDLIYSDERDQETILTDSSVEERSDDPIVDSEVLKNSHSHEIWRVYKTADERKCGKEIATALKSAFCSKPRNRTIYLDYFSTSDTIEPSAIEVPRCDGHCSTGLSCMASKKSKMNVHVQLTNHHTKKRTCADIVVEKHDMCKCACAIRKEDCNPDRQDYENCRCVCRDPEERLRCELMNRQWDPQTCNCMCAERRECSTGEIFHDQTCRCERYMIMPNENEIY